jgi:formyl-CoA transferase
MQAGATDVATTASVPETDARPGALDGVRVLEVGSLIAGPFAGRLLAELGAEVIKIEAPDRPDPLREWGVQRHEGHTMWWAVQSRNKRCITLDLRQPRGQELFRSLAARSDVVVENFRPGTMERWGVGWEQLHELDRPMAHRGGFAAVAEAVGGLRYINGYPDQKPPRAGISLGDSLAAMFAMQGVLSALYWRDARGGEGQLVDVALTEACFALLESAVPEYDLTGVDREPQGSRIASNVPSNVFRSRDERWVVIAANVDTLFRRLTAVIGRPELADDERFANHAARSANRDEIEGIIAAWASERDAQEIDRLLDEAGVPCGPVNRISDIFADPQFRARDMLVPMHDEQLGDFVGPGVVPKLSATPGQVRWSGPPRPGTHNDAVYGDLLGLSEDERAQLAQERVI